MVEEKNAAFGESWRAMVAQAAVANQAFAASYFDAFVSLASGRRPAPPVSAARFGQAAMTMMTKGLAPVHRRATANARRLAKTKLR